MRLKIGKLTINMLHLPSITKTQQIMKQIFKTIMLAAAVALSAHIAPAQIAYVTVGDVKYRVNPYNNTATANACATDSPVEVVIDGTVEYNGKQYPVTGIDEEAFYDKSSITSVTIPGSVTSIGESAFNGCKSLSSLNLPDALKTIGRYALEGTAITSVTIPSTVTSIGTGAFSFCRKLTSVAFETPSRLTQISSDVFSYCSALESFTIPASVTSVSYNAFYKCDKLTAFHVEDGNTKYAEAEGLLYSKDGTTVVACPPGMKGEITIPGSPTTIGEYSFFNLNGITRIVVPNTVTAIGEAAFLSCMYLESIDLGTGLSSIGNYAFQGCSDLSEMTLPASVTSVGDGAFDLCQNLSRITVEAVVPPTAKDNSFETSVCETAILAVPAASVAAYKEATGWKNFTKIEALPEPEPVVLSVALPNGVISLTQAGKQETPITIVPDEGYKISTATLGGEDITAGIDAEGAYTVPALTESKTLSVVFVKRTTTDAADAAADAAMPRVYAYGGEIRVEGAEPGTEVKVYDLAGRCVITTTMHSFAVPGSGAYILTVQGHTYKFAL